MLSPLSTRRGQRKAKRGGSKKAAELVRDKIDAALKLGHVDVLDGDRRAVPARAPTFAEYAERWLETVGPVRVRPATLEQYRSRLKLRLLPALGLLPVTSIKRESLRTLIGELARDGNRRNPERSISRGTVRETLQTLSVILSTAEEDGLIPANPARGWGKYLAQTGAEEVEEAEVFTREELRQVLERGWPEYFPFILCLARTGMRLGEAIALEWRDVDFDTRVILVRRSRRPNRVSVPKNGKARR